MSVLVRAAALSVAFLIVVGLGVFAAVYYIGGTSALPNVHYAASNGQVNVALQEDPGNDSATAPAWVTYYVYDPTTKNWEHTTLFTVPANTKVNMTIYGFDGCTPLRNNFWSYVQGVDGNTVTVQQFDKNNKPLGAPTTTSVIDSWADCNVAHTFAIPGMNIYVPVPSPNAQNSKKNLCSSFPCTTSSGGAYALETFSFTTPAHGGVFRWQCLIPCGGGYIDGNSGPMQTLGYMMGEMTVVTS